jgi:Na+-exporting ATPase
LVQFSLLLSFLALTRTPDGIITAALCLATFTLIVFGFADGNLGIDSNNSIGEGSLTVFRARSATFALLTWLTLFLAAELLDMRRSFFRMKPKSKQYVPPSPPPASPLTSNVNSYFTQWARDMYTNPFLLYSVSLGALSVFPLIYIPGLNTAVLKHAPIGGLEWGIVLIATFLFIVMVEGYKWGKRVFIRMRGAKKVGIEVGGELIFKEWMTMTETNTLALQTPPV